MMAGQACSVSSDHAQLHFTNRFFVLSNPSNVFRMSSPIASMRLIECGSNCGSNGLRAGPPDTSSTASNLYGCACLVLGSVHVPCQASGRFLGQMPYGS